jgi:hypothetical protein
VPADLVEIALTVAQDPPGPSVHQLWVRQRGGTLTRVHVFRGVTRDGDVLRFIPDEPLRDVELVRVVTRELGDLAPAWREIELLSDMLDEEIRRDFGGDLWVHTRGSVIQRVFIHDVYHVAELNETLIARGLPQVDLWD